jgi:ferredoxin
MSVEWHEICCNIKTWKNASTQRKCFMRVMIDREECTGCADCWEVCPEVFDENEDDGLAQLVLEYRENGFLGQGEVPDELKDSVQTAADECPVEVIQIIE